MRSSPRWDEPRTAAQLTQQMARQINALTAAHESTARTAARALALRIIGLVLAIGVVLAIVL